MRHHNGMADMSRPAIDPTWLHERRPSLVRLCAALSGELDAAEDLAQEALLEAWRHSESLRDPTARDAWLAGVARNVCLRRRRTQTRERVHRVEPSRDESAEAVGEIEQLVAEDDLELELERDELAALLDRALALLPLATREALVEHYLRERGQAEIAARLGVSENVIAVRIHRGKLALRRALTTTFQAEAISYGLLDARTAGWQETRLWCPECGARHLLGRMPAPPALTAYQLRCPACHTEPGVYMANAPRDRMAFDLEQVRGYKRVLDRLMTDNERFYQLAHPARFTACPRCGHPVEIHRGMPPDSPRSIRDVPGMHAVCEGCGWESAQGIGGMLLCLPEARRFWRQHPRIHMLPLRVVETAGRAAFVSSFVTVEGTHRLDIVSAMDNLRTLGVYSNGRALAGE